MIKYQDLRKEAETITHSKKTEILHYDGVAYKIFDKSCDTAQIFHEAMLQVIAAGAGLRVPKMLGIDRVDDRFAILYEYIEGKTLSELMEENPAKKSYYLGIMADTQILINSKRVSDIRKLKNKIKRDLNEAADLDEIRRYELETTLSSMPDHDKFCHGNFGPENIIIDDMDKIVILNWGNAAKGNASSDAARAYLKLSVISTELAEAYITLFCEKAGTKRQYVYEWIPLIAVSSLRERNISEREKKLLLSWLDVAAR